MLCCFKNDPAPRQVVPDQYQETAQRIQAQGVGAIEALAWGIPAPYAKLDTQSKKLLREADLAIDTRVGQLKQDKRSIRQDENCCKKLAHRIQKAKQDNCPDNADILEEKRTSILERKAQNLIQYRDDCAQLRQWAYERDRARRTIHQTANLQVFNALNDHEIGLAGRMAQNLDNRERIAAAYVNPHAQHAGHNR